MADIHDDDDDDAVIVDTPMTHGLDGAEQKQEALAADPAPASAAADAAPAAPASASVAAVDSASPPATPSSESKLDPEPEPEPEPTPAPASPPGGLTRRVPAGSSLPNHAGIAAHPVPAATKASSATATKASSAAATTAAAAAAPGPGKGRRLAELLGRAASKAPLVVGAIDKVQALLVEHTRLVQVYVAGVLLLFGSYFLSTIRCYEAVSRLGFIDQFARLYARVKAVADANKGQVGGRKVSAMWLQLRPYLGEMARTTFLCATCCLGILLSYLAGSLIIGASIGSRLDEYLDEFELRPALDKLTARVKRFDWTREITSILLIAVSTIFSLFAPASATALCSLLMAAKVLAKIKVEWGKPEKTVTAGVKSGDDKLDVISFRFWTGALLAAAVVANFILQLEFSWFMMFLSLPLVVLENVICVFA